MNLNEKNIMDLELELLKNAFEAVLLNVTQKSISTWQDFIKTSKMFLKHINSTKIVNKHE